jgi:glycosyltransferase involved in cell wall biosynthesis
MDTKSLHAAANTHSTRLRISFILSSFWLSGGVRDIVEYANRLAERGHTVTIVVPGGTEDPDMMQEIWPGVRVVSSHMQRPIPINPVQMARLTWSLARAVPPSDVVISTHTPTTAAGFCASRLMRKGRPVWYYQDYVEMFEGRPIETWLARNALRWHDLALVFSEYSAQELQAAPGRAVVVGEGLSHAETFQPLSETQRAQARTGSERLILYLGDMRPRKGWHDFLQAAALVYEQQPDIRLCIVSKEECIVESHVPHDYIYRPSREELARLYATCDVFVSASWWESFGIPPLEAMACGAPVVMTDSRGVREFGEHGVNCLMTPPRDPPALAAAIGKVLTMPDLSAKLRQNGPPTAARFTWERATDRFENAILGLFQPAHQRHDARSAG